MNKESYNRTAGATESEDEKFVRMGATPNFAEYAQSVADAVSKRDSELDRLREINAELLAALRLMLEAVEEERWPTRAEHLAVLEMSRAAIQRAKP